jgi:hypothetical protein
LEEIDENNKVERQSKILDSINIGFTNYVSFIFSLLNSP